MKTRVVANTRQVPWAFALAHGPHMYAVICGGKLYDNENPRNFRDAVTSSQAVDSAVRHHPQPRPRLKLRY